MSKNVAVFIDVANIFYAAKAAGVDIDYVQLLKTATAGRDLVRAYAYTGLDPENDNQKQFHSFLGRHGYRVVSKDIRKYGDGRVKANLDIELVVDMMRTASNLDIAVVVSGDGDFAPAIRAVQDLGVRVEVISFRANTSSDLIDVADVFTDIREIARVDKGSSRSGRRVASDEEDLSMTAVPEKESEGPVRRRRGGRGRGSEREEVRREPAALSEGAGLVALPGEKLSRGAERSNGTAAAEALEATGGPVEGHEAEPEGEGRRRRRRRGGRGRGRGRERSQELAEVQPSAGPDEGDEVLADYEPPRLPASSTFGSVWDSQIGMTPPASAPGAPIDESYEDEPEIPEYLIAERRQRGRGPRVPNARGPRRGRGGAYQSALDRERYGGARTSLPTPPFSSGGGPGRGGAGRPRDRRPAESATPRGAGGEEPWSEVPPEVADLLRAELARKRSTPGGPAAAEARSSANLAAEAPEAPARRPRGRRSATASGVETATSPERAAPGEGDEALAPRPRTTGSRSAAASTEATDGGAGSDTAATPARRTSRRRTSAATSEEGTAGEAAGPAVGEAAQSKPRRTRRTVRPGAEAPGN